MVRDLRAIDQNSSLILSYVDQEGSIAVERVAADFGMSKNQLAEMLGLARKTLDRSAINRDAQTQSRLEEMLEIVIRVANWAGCKEQAMAWYRTQPLPALGGRTSEALVKNGRAGAVRDYLDHVTLGGFA